MKYLFLRCFNILYIRYDDIRSLSCKNMNTLFIHGIFAYKSQTMFSRDNVKMSCYINYRNLRSHITDM